jgi:hypothetical protein
MEGIFHKEKIIDLLSSFSDEDVILIDGDSQYTKKKIMLHAESIAEDLLQRDILP